MALDDTSVGIERDPVDNPAVIHDHQRQKFSHDVITRLFVFTSFPWQPGIRFSYSRSNESSRQVDSGPAVPGSPFDRPSMIQFEFFFYSSECIGK